MVVGPPILATKIAAPVPPSPFLVRDGLYRILDGALDVPLTVVVGPAGAGKSTLVAGWIRTQPPSVRHAWVNADSADTTSRLFRHIGEALSGRHDGPADGSTPALLELLRRGARSGPVVIVVDDLSLVRSRHVVQQLDTFVEEAPDHVHLVLVTRADPSFLPRWRARGRGFVEIRRRDLRLTDAEVAAMVAAHPRVTLDGATLGDLTDKVDGWAAGLQLALASLAHSDHPARTVASFGGATPAVAEYLLDEVLAHLDGPSRAFLLDVSVLDVLTPDACRRLTGRDDAADVVAELAGDNLLIERYSDASYRYHPLLQQLLQLHLRRADEAHYQHLHRWAAAEAEDRGDLVDAVEHLLAAEDYAAAVTLCGRDRGTLVDGDGTALLPRWLARIPPYAFDDIDDQLGAAELMLAAGDALGCAFRLERCHAALGEHPSNSSRARIARLRSHCHHRLGDPEAALRNASEVDALRAGDERADRGRPDDDVAIPRGFGLLWTGRLDEARSVMAHRPRPPAPAADDPVALGLAARIELEAGDLPAGRVLVRRALTLADERGLDATHPDRLHARLAHAQLLVEAVADIEADDAVRSLLEAADTLGARDHTVVGLILQARLRWSSTCVAAGLGALAAAAHLDLDRPLSPALRAVLDRFETRLRIEAGDTEDAARILERIPSGPDRVVLESRLAAASGSVDAALAALDVAIGRRSRAGFEAALTRARILADAGDDRAPAAIRRVLEHPLAPHLRRTYLEEGERFGGALSDLSGPGAAIAAELDRARQRTATTALSGRELAVLQFLPTRLTNQEIGGQIFVSPNTVKTHLKSLYRRLGVGSRDEAVRRARQLGLLPPDRDVPPRERSAHLGSGVGVDHIGLEGQERQAQVAEPGDHRVDIQDHALQSCGPR